jgi:hypothetical protein
MNIGNRVIYHNNVANIIISDDVSKLFSEQIRKHIINKVSNQIWTNIIGDVMNVIRLNLHNYEYSEY